MEVYVLDSLLRRSAVFDQFESLIWSERLALKGDFKMVIESTNNTRNSFSAQTLLAMNESHRVMVVESVESYEDYQGRNMLTVQGWSLETVLESRVARQNFNNLTDTANWVIEGTADEIASYIFDQICVQGVLDSSDIIPFLGVTSPLPLGDISPPTEELVMELTPQSVYTAISDICKAYDLGFRIIRDPVLNSLHFDIYYGTDRTGQQTINEPVIFSKELDNFQSVRSLSSTAELRNVCYVFSNEGTEIVYSQGADADTSGFDRRVLYLNVSETQDEDSDQTLSEFLQQKGKEALAEQKPFSGFDGEVPQYSPYKYGIHYRLGDLVETRNPGGGSNHMRVSEQIFTSDSQGEKSYPTLTTDLYINPGSWLGWDMSEEWFEVEGEWSEAP